MLSKIRKFNRTSKAVSVALSALIAWMPVQTSYLAARALAMAAVSAVVTTHESWMPAVYADAFTDAAIQGNSFGFQLGQGFSMPGQINGGSAQFPDSGISININDLYPGSNGTENSSIWGDLYGDDDAMQEAGFSAQERLLFESSPEGDAYRVVRETASMPRPDLSNDPIWGQTDDVVENIDVIAAGFTDCEEESFFVDGNRNVRVPDYQTCERLDSPSFSEMVTHNYDIDVRDPAVRVQSLVSRQLRYGFCRSSTCTDYYGNKVGQGTAMVTDIVAVPLQTTTSSCTSPEGTCVQIETRAPRREIDYRVETIELNLATENQAAIKELKVTRFQWDDWARLFVNGSQVWEGHNGYMPPREWETHGSHYVSPSYGWGDPSTEWSWNGNLDLRPYLDGSDHVEIQMRTSTRVGGWGGMRLQIVYDEDAITGVVNEKGWGPQSVLDRIADLDPQLCRIAYSISNGPNLDANGCMDFEGAKICPDAFDPSPLPGVSPLAREVMVTADCDDFFLGEMDCFTDVNGNQVCHTNTKENTTNNTCRALEEDPKCGFVSTQCIEGAVDANGRCLVWEEVWDCGETVQVPSTTAETRYRCAGDIRCMGEECVAPQREQSMDFEKAVAAIQAIQYMRLDGECDITGCTAFTGTPMECKKAVGGVVNCCTKPDNVSLGDYIQLIVMTDRVAMAESMSGTVLQGAWETLRTPIVNSPSATWQAIRGDFASAWDTLTGAGEAVAEGAKDGLVDQALQKLTEKVAQWTKEVFGQAAHDALFSVTEGAGAMGGDLVTLNPQIGAALNFLMTAYTVYLVAMILVQVIWACEQSEFELGAKRQLKSCTFTGSYCKKKVLGTCIEKRETYCCFNSPLSRIIQEQAQSQLGVSLKESGCLGMTFDMLAELDWDQIDLSEWIGILVQTGNMPGDQIDIDTLTGEASLIGTEGRLNVRERSEQRLDGLDSASLRHNAEEHLRGSVP